ncbi:phage head-tail joining protein [Niveispirillum sp.]|uniref:phage head-tail joining protein n=1 Tax=Niveispirillum sp. TaxID=1917217 RepID=UPI004035EE72
MSVADLAQLTAWRDALMAARYRGVRTVEYDGKRVTHAGDGEMVAALADLNRQIAEATHRISVVRIQSSKGL